jgi:prepilin-type N-terminal cleavage/methylation domain-containing protein
MEVPAMRVPAVPQGFTLVELMVSLLVLTLLTALATPSFVDFFERNRVRGAAEAVASLINNARAEAVKNDLDVNVAMTGTGSAWCLGGNAAAAASGGAPAGSANACDCTDSAACLVGGQRMAIERGAYPDVTASTPLASPMLFDSTLGALTPLGTQSLVLTSPHGKYDVAVRVSALGQARLCTPLGRPMMSDLPTC